MGVTIHFSGVAENEANQARVLSIARGFAAEHDWAAEPVDRQPAKLIRLFPIDEPLTVIDASVRRVIQKPATVYESGLKGMAIYPTEQCEPCYLAFDDNGHVQGSIKTQFAGVDLHEHLIELLRKIEPEFDSLSVADEGGYWETSDRQKLQKAFASGEQSIELLVAMLPDSDSAETGVRAESGDIYDILDADGIACNAAIIGEDEEDTDRLRLLADRGVAIAQWRVGEILHELGDVEAAFPLLKRAAKWGVASAQYLLGECFRKGVGVTIDFSQAVFWYSQAAAQNFNEASEALIGRYAEEFNDDYTAEDFVDAAKAGDPYAQYRLALCYWIGRGVDEDPIVAADWFEKSAESGFADSQFFYGACFRDETGREKDAMVAVEWFAKAAAQSSPLAHEALGFARLSGEGIEKNEEWAVRHFRTAADMGLPSAMGVLGDCYSEGRGVEASEEMSFQWFEKAAHLGHSMGMASVGDCYLRGAGVEQNEMLAIEHFREALKIDADNMYAQCCLGECYQRGWGVVRDPDRAAYWFHLAADQGNAYAQMMMGHYYESDMNDVPSFDVAVLWHRRAVEAGFPPAYSRLASMYLDGRGVQRDPAEAFRLWNRGAEAGDDSATTRLGMCFEHGLGVAADPAQAFGLYLQAAEQGDDWARTLAAMCLLRGRGTNRDQAAAIELLREAAEAGHETAQLELGFCYEYGRGVERDVDTASEYYQRATHRSFAPIPLGRFETNQPTDDEDDEDNYSTLFHFTREAAEQGEAWALNNFGAYFHAAHGVAPDFEMALECFQEAAEQNFSQAYDNLGFVYEMGLGVEPNAQAAFEAYSSAAKLGCPGAQASLGYFHHHGMGTEVNLEAAIQWYRSAAEQGEESAAQRLGGLYECGIGVELDLQEALRWYKIAESDPIAEAAVRRVQHILERPSDRDAFALQVMEWIRANGEKRMIEYDNETFRIFPEGDSSFFLALDHLFHAYQMAGRDDRASIFESAIHHWNIAPSGLPESFDEAREDILPAVRPLTYFESLGSQLNTEHEAWPHLVLGEHLGAALVYDMQESMVYLTHDMLDSWGVTIYEVFEAARENLVDLSSDPFIQLREGLFQANGRDSYDASRLLLTTEIRDLGFSGDIIAVAPNRETLLVADADNYGALSALLEKVYESLKDPRPISQMAFELVGDEWRPWLPEPSHSLFADFKSLQLQYFRAAYDEQANLMKKPARTKPNRERAADYSVAVDPDTGEPFSYCVWGPSDLLLPRCEKIVLTAELYGNNSLQASWETIFAKLGDRLQPLEGYPELYRVKTPLNAEEIERLRRELS